MLKDRSDLLRSHAFRLLFVGLTCLTPIRAESATPAQINISIEKAIAYLYAHQQPAGNWEYASDADHLYGPNQRNYVGRTALVTYALLAAGEEPKNPHLAGPIDFLEKTPTAGTYAVGVRAQVWPYLKQTRQVHEAEEADARILLSSVGTRGEADGMWYYTPPNTGTYDHSVSQFGILGLWALDQKGVEIPSGLWQRADEGWRKHQLADGSWCYSNTGGAVERQSTTTMTAAGVATLFITSDFVHQQFNSNEVVDANIEGGLKWLGDHFDLFFANGIANVVTQWYGMYGLERIGVASGRKYLGTHNWFVQGSDWLIHNQNADGSWGAPSDIWSFNQQNILDTSFAILFLARGRAPVIMEKVQYDGPAKGGKPVPGHWNRTPRDLANFSRWMGTQLEQDLNWQVTSLDVPAEDLHDAPILFISGDQPLTLSDSEVAKLRRFVEEGGLILGNADSQSLAFTKSFKELGAALFPSYAFRELPANHPIYVNEEFRAARWALQPHVEGLSNGVRELMLLPGVDFSRAFGANRTAGHPEAYELADDIVLYSVDTRGLAQKGETYTVAEDAKIPIDRTLKIARLQYDGNWDPEPGGWRRLAAILHNGQKIALKVDAVKLGDGSLITPPAPTQSVARPSDKEIRQMAVKRIPPAVLSAAAADDPDKEQALIKAQIDAIHKELDAADALRAVGNANFTIAHLTGTDELKLTDAQREELKKFVEAGGTLIIDAAGGSTAFAASAEQMLRDTFGSDAGQIESPLLPDCPLYQQPGRAIDSVQYRQFARSRISNTRMPQLRGIRIVRRLAVIYSREDLSAGLVGEPVDGVTGYTPASATELMKNVILWTADSKAVKTPVPTGIP